MINSSAIIGYSGHAHVICDTCELLDLSITAYCDIEKKEFNPFKLKYLGFEEDHEVLKRLKSYQCHVSIGNNTVRDKLLFYLENHNIQTFSVIHPGSSISRHATVASGVFIGPGVVVNAFAALGTGVIANSGCVIEHDCIIKRSAHVAPGAILAGGVQIGERAMIGANATIREQVIIGENATVGAGSVVVQNVDAGDVVVGNPARSIKRKN